MSSPSKTSRLGRGAYRRPSADVLDDLTDPVPRAAPQVTSGVSGDGDTVGVEGGSGVSVTADTSATPAVLVTGDDPSISVVAGVEGSLGDPDTDDTHGVLGDQDVEGVIVTAGTSDGLDSVGLPGTADNPGVAGTAGIASTSDNLDGSVAPGAAGNAGTAGTAGTSENPGAGGNADVSHSPGGRPRRGAAKQRAAVAEVDVSGNRGTSDTSSVKSAATPRDHVKVARPLVAEMRDAVWFLSEHGRPRVQLGELLDEAIGAWLRAAKADHNGGQAFPVKGRLR